MSMLYLAQPDQHQQLEWLDGGTLSLLLDNVTEPELFSLAQLVNLPNVPWLAVIATSRGSAIGAGTEVAG